jgi:hypothetical protein
VLLRLLLLSQDGFSYRLFIDPLLQLHSPSLPAPFASGD